MTRQCCISEVLPGVAVQDHEGGTARGKLLRCTTESLNYTTRSTLWRAANTTPRKGWHIRPVVRHFPGNSMACGGCALAQTSVLRPTWRCGKRAP